MRKQSGHVTGTHLCKVCVSEISSEVSESREGVSKSLIMEEMRSKYSCLLASSRSRPVNLDLGI